MRAVDVQEGGEAADRPAGKPVKWANPILQKRAWSNAWLALLAVPLPEGILRKVNSLFHPAALAQPTSECTPLICLHHPVSGTLSSVADLPPSQYVLGS